MKRVKRVFKRPNASPFRMRRGVQFGSMAARLLQFLRLSRSLSPAPSIPFVFLSLFLSHFIHLPRRSRYGFSLSLSFSPARMLHASAFTPRVHLLRVVRFNRNDASHTRETHTHTRTHARTHISPSLVGYRPVMTVYPYKNFELSNA